MGWFFIGITADKKMEGPSTDPLSSLCQWFYQIISIVISLSNWLEVKSFS